MLNVYEYTYSRVMVFLMLNGIIIKITVKLAIQGLLRSLKNKNN